MKEATVVVLVVICLVFSTHANGQMNRYQIKRNNKRMAHYRGPAQTFSIDKRYTSVSLTFNTLNYYGDLSPSPSPFSTDLSLTRPAVGISVSRRRGPRYTIQGNFVYGRIEGSDTESANKKDLDNGVYRYNRNLSFRNNIKELSLVFIFDYFDNHSRYTHRVDWTPYAFAGVAVLHHNPQARVPETGLDGNPLPNANRWVDLQPLGTEGQHAELLKTDANYGLKPYKRIQPALPLGFGVRFRVKSRMDLSIEYSFRYMFTDYLDDVSRNYVDLGIFGSNETSRALSYRSNEIVLPTHTYISPRDGQTYNVINGYGAEHPSNVRGNKKDNDTYFVLTMRFAYILPGKLARAKTR
jgi:hypothetical protein